MILYQTHFEKLNSQQQKAASILDGPVLVIAGAGSGKTQTMTIRIANLLLHGIKPSQIFCATFTNKAANNMKDRIKSICGEEAVQGIWMGTFHSLCVRILRKYVHLIGYTPQFTIYDQSDAEKMVYRIFELHGLNKRFHPRQGIEFISRAKNNLMNPEDAALYLVKNQTDEVMSIVYRDYQKLMQATNAMDFDDLIMLTVLLIQNHEQVKAFIKRTFTHVLADEYQDINDAQFYLLKLLSEHTRHLFVVGDDAQAIYGFRGSDLKHILQFEQTYPDCQTIYLEQNYRSTKTIVDAGNHVISFNPNQKKKQLFSQKEQGQSIAVMELDDEFAEAGMIGYLIQQKMKKEHCSYDDFAILYRINAQSSPFEKIFMSQLIPYQIIGGMSFYQREEIKDLLSYLRLVYNPKDDVALMRIINKPTRGIGDATVEKLEAYALSHNTSLFQTCRLVDSIGSITSKTRQKVRYFADLILHFQHKKNLNPIVFVNYILDQTGYKKMWEEKKTQEAFEKLEYINEFLKHLSHYMEIHQEEDNIMESFLQDISMISNLNQEDVKGVKLMTMHSAKGLEFPYVFLIGCNEGVFPSYRAETEHDIQEERRLMYVGVTRAEKELYCTHTQYRTNIRGGMSKAKQSRFINELPEQLTKTFDLKKKQIKKEK